MNTAAPRLDIIIPVYNEGANIVPTLRALARDVKTPSRILICYDHDEDNTLPAIADNRDSSRAFAKQYWQALFETQYRWKRFTIGARYAIGLEPYVTITLLNSPAQKERNRSLSIFIRYEIWNSRPRR